MINASHVVLSALRFSVMAPGFGMGCSKLF
jgi:hypothetical protein